MGEERENEQKKKGKCRNQKTQYGGFCTTTDMLRFTVTNSRIYIKSLTMEVGK